MSEIKFFDKVKGFMGIPLSEDAVNVPQSLTANGDEPIIHKKPEVLQPAGGRSDEVSRLEKLAAESPFGKNQQSLNSSELIVLEPRSFEECVEIVSHLRNNKSVIMNVQNMDVAQGQRLVDYVCGAVLALDGNQERISSSIFLFAPGNVNVKSFIKAEKIRDEGGFFR